MTYPSRKKLTEYPIVTPTLGDSAVSIQGNTVKRSTLQSIFNLFSANLPPAPSPTLPYKVFTGLLTQNGGSVLQNRNAGDTLTKGVTYYIVSNGGYNFIPLGAPNNEVGTYFICNQNITTSLGVPFDLQFNTGAPVIDILENTLGNVWFTYQTNGNYLINSNSLFTTNKTWGIIATVYNNTFSVPAFLGIGVGDSSYKLIYTFDNTLIGNGNLNDTPIEIRVYN
jgi:hypothetical protein